MDSLPIKNIIVLFIVTLIFKTSMGQTLYVMNQKNSNQTEFLSSVNPSTGAVNIISQNALTEFAYNGLSALDPINNRFFFISTDDTLFTIDLISGNLLYKVKFSTSNSHSPALMEYNCNDNTLYIINQQISNQGEFLASVDPTNGNTTIISATKLTTSIYNGISAIDPIENRFFFLSTNDTLFSVDLVSGNLISKQKISSSNSFSPVLIEFNPLDSILYMLNQKNLDQTEFLASVNPSNGNTTIISSTGLTQFAYNGASTIDPIGNRFFFLSTNDSLFTVDILTGSLISKQQLSTTGVFSPIYLEYDNNCQIVGTNFILSNNTKEVILSPNPSTGTINIDLKGKYSYEVYNSLGQKVTPTLINNNQISLNQVGVYVIKITNENKTYTKRVIIQ